MSPRKTALHELTRKQFEALVARALDRLPAPFRARLENIAVVVEEEPTEEELEALGIEPGGTVLGAYWGEPLPNRTPSGYWGVLPDRIVIYRGPILRCCRTVEEAEEEVRDTVIHELGHYFGLNDEGMPY